MVINLSAFGGTRIAAILAANVYYAGETPAVQIQIPTPLNYRHEMQFR